MVNKPPEDLFLDLEVPENENTLINAVLMAATFLVVLPLITGIAFLQKKFMQGIEHSGLVE